MVFILQRSFCMKLSSIYKINRIPDFFLYRIWSAMKHLNNQINCTEMKFWGKIFGLYCDYYIVQVG